MSKQAADHYQSLTEVIGQLRKRGEGDSGVVLDAAGEMDGPWHGMTDDERTKATVHELRVYRETSNE
jgi:hypothetical protein